MKTKASTLLILAAIAIAAVLPAQAGFVCTNCNDTGSVRIKCPLCKGTKYLWKCQDTSYASGTYNSLLDPDVFCGYDAVYTPFHPNCKRTRTRINCPMCLSKSKSSSTGIAEIDCPACDGKGNLVYNLIAVTDEGLIVQSDLDATLPLLESGKPSNRPHILHRQFSTEEIKDFVTVYPEARFFRTTATFREFVRQTLIRKLADGYTTTTVTSHGKPIDYTEAQPAKK